jgi:hypothetical protein
MTTKLTAEDLRGLKPLTAGDFYWGHKHADKLSDGGDDPQDLMFHVTHHAAVRAGKAEEDDIQGFLDKVALSDISEVFGKELTEDESGPLAEPTGT